MLTARVVAMIPGFAIVESAGPADASVFASCSVFLILGDSINVADQRYRLVGFEASETSHARCDYGLTLEQAATARWLELVETGLLRELAVSPEHTGQDFSLAWLIGGRRHISDGPIAERPS